MGIWLPVMFTMSCRRSRSIGCANAVAVVLDVKGGGGECAAAPIVADIVGYALTVSGLTEGTYRIRLTTTGSLPADTATVSIAPMPLAQ